MAYNYHLRVDRSKWANGSNLGMRDSGLAIFDDDSDPEHPACIGHCCMGLLAIDCGYKDEVLESSANSIGELPRSWGCLPVSHDDACDNGIYQINDDSGLTEEDREKRLKEACGELGLRLTFFGKLRKKLD